MLRKLKTCYQHVRDILYYRHVTNILQNCYKYVKHMLQSLFLSMRHKQQIIVHIPTVSVLTMPSKKKNMAYKKVIQRTFGGIFYASSCVFIRFVFASCGFQSSNSDTRLFKSTQIRQFDELPRGVCHASAHPPTGSSFIKSRRTERETEREKKTIRGK